MPSFFISAKYIHRGLPLQSAQADQGLNCLLLINFVHVKGRIYRMIYLDVRKMYSMDLILCDDILNPSSHNPDF